MEDHHGGESVSLQYHTMPLYCPAGATGLRGWEIVEIVDIPAIHLRDDSSRRRRQRASGIGAGCLFWACTDVKKLDTFEILIYSYIYWPLS